MPSSPSDERLEQAILKSVKDGLYPEEEAVLSAELPSSALGSLEELLQNARKEVESSIRELSRLSAPDIDGWISQAKQLRNGIAATQDQSNEIVALGTDGYSLVEAERDASGKVSFLEAELSFNGSLGAALDEVQSITNSLNSTQQAVSHDQILDAIGFLKKSEMDLAEFREHQDTAVGGILANKSTELKDVIAASLRRHWNKMVQVDKGLSKITINNNVEGSTLDMGSAIKGLSSLGLLKDYTVALGKAFANLLLVPCIHQASARPVGSIVIKGNSIELSEGPKPEPKDLLQNLADAIQFLYQRLPQSVSRLLGDFVISSTTSQLTSDFLLSIVPSDLGGVPKFRSDLEAVTSFAAKLDELGARNGQPIHDWVTGVPKTWLAKRSESSLNSIRQLLKRGLGITRAVERVETQVISSEDKVFAAGDDQGDDWDAGWNEESQAQENDQAQATDTAGANSSEDGQEDEDAWGFGDEETGQQKQENVARAGEEAGDGGDAWGWGEEEGAPTDPSKSQQSTALKATARPQTNGQPKKTSPKPPVDRTVTLKETYHITAIPEQIVEIIIMVFQDAERLSVSDITQNPVAPAARSLAALPDSLLAMYRAIAPNFYGHDINGNMFIYNDCCYIAEQLRSFSTHRQNRASGNELASLEDTTSTLELFGKRSYGKEMESQRTILRDLLDGAQGFMNCAEQPFAEQCDLAVSSTVDRLNEVRRQWAPVLSRSALMQSTGSLLGTVTNKIIVDVGDMGDISEPESQRLVALCNRVVELDSLFLPERLPDADPDEPLVPLTAGYTPSWLKFQYLTNILESSLIDIKYLWTEGELSLEFSADEVIDLIEALFADSEHRRRAISEIRKGSR